MTFRTFKSITVDPQGIATVTYKDGTTLTLYPETMESTLSRLETSTIDDHLVGSYRGTDEH